MTFGRSFIVPPCAIERVVDFHGTHLKGEGEALLFAGTGVAARLRVATAVGLSIMVLMALLKNEMFLVRGAGVSALGPMTLPGNVYFVD